ncbi:MAG: hypothetical protein AAGC92_13970 [Pseudomonadota bacterium]
MAKRKRHAPRFKVMTALEALKGVLTVAVLPARFAGHPAPIQQSKKALK